MSSARKSNNDPPQASNNPQKPPYSSRVRNITLNRYGSATATLRTLTHTPPRQTQDPSKPTGQYDKSEPLPAILHVSSPPEAQQRPRTVRATVIDQYGRANIRNHLPPRRLNSAVAGPSAGMRRGSPSVVTAPRPNPPPASYQQQQKTNPTATTQVGHKAGTKPGNVTNMRKGVVSLNTILPPHNNSSTSGSVTDSQMFPYANMTATRPKKNTEFSTFNVLVESHVVDPKALQSAWVNNNEGVAGAAADPDGKRSSEVRADDKSECGIREVTPPKCLQDVLLDSLGNNEIVTKKASKDGTRRPTTAAGKLYGVNVKSKVFPDSSSSLRTGKKDMSDSSSPKIRRLPPTLPFWAFGSLPADEAAKKSEEVKRPFSAPSTPTNKFHLTELGFLEALKKPEDFGLDKAHSGPTSVHDFTASNITETELLKAALKEVSEKTETSSNSQGPQDDPKVENPGESTEDNDDKS